jgi:alkylated DNA repair dioxygenase AlkB
MQFEYFSEPNGEISCIGYCPNFLSKKEEQNLLDYLNETSDWRGGRTGFGHNVPRLQKWFHQDMLPFASTWHKQHARWQPFAYDAFLKTFQDTVVSRISKTIASKLPDHPSVNKKPVLNSVLMNYYRDGSDTIKRHRDSQPEFGENPTVIGINVGGTRTLRFERVVYDPNNPASLKVDKKRSPLTRNIELQSGSLVVMAGAVQKYFCHSVPRVEKSKPRYSLTFREHNKL